MRHEKLIVLTRGYPTSDEGEEFFSFEIEALDNTFESVTYLPYPGVSNPKSLLETARVLLERIVKGLRYFPLHSFYWETLWLFRNGRIKPKYLWNLVTDGLQTGIRVWQIRSIGFQPDMIYSFWGGPDGLASALESSRCPKGSFVRLHGFDLYEIRRSGFQPYLRSIARSEAAVILLSKSALNYFTSVSETRASLVIPLGVDPGRNIHSHRKLDPLHFLTIAYPSPIKRLDYTAKLLAEFSKTTSEGVTWTHIGGGPLQHEEFKSIFRSYGGNGDLHFHTSMKHAEAIELVERSEAGWVVNTSLSEGTPVSLMEAMVRGKNVFASDVGGIKDLLEDTFGNVIFRPDEPLQTTLDRLIRATADMKTAPNLSNIEKIRQNFHGSRNAGQLLRAFERSAG